MKKLKFLALLICPLMISATFLGCSNKPAASSSGNGAMAVKDITHLLVAVDVRSLSNPYLVTVVDGAKMFAASLPASENAKVQVITNEGSDETEINNVKAVLAKGGKQTIMYVDANEAPDIATIAPLCEKAGVYWGSVWNVPDGYVPSLAFPHWVLHQSPNDQTTGYNTATEMFKDFPTPNTGKILAIQGLLANNPSINRFKGLQKALSEHTGVTLLDQQNGDWLPEKALSITQAWLTKYSDIQGIWCANDDMAVAVVQALKAKGLNGKVKVTGCDATDPALAAIKAGDMVATVSANGWMQGGYTEAYAYAALTGVINTATMDQTKRVINTKSVLITTSTLADYEAKYVTTPQKFDFTDLSFPIATT
jgi:ribose transport system substrate-binding protein